MKRPPHVAIVVKRFPKLSETFVLNEILALENAGIKLTIFHLYPASDTLIHADVERVFAENYFLKNFPFRTLAGLFFSKPRKALSALKIAIEEFGFHFLTPFRQAATFSMHLRRLDIDAIHSHFIDAPAGVSRIASSLAGTPYSISAHAKDIYTSPEKALKRRLNCASFTATCTAHNAAFLSSLAPKAAIRRIYHGVDIAAFPAKQEKSETQQPPLIISVGRLRKKKGFDTLIDACALLNARNVRFRCNIIGYGPEDSALLHQIKLSKLHGIVSLLGKRPHDEVKRQMAHASVFALPCRITADGDRDGIPNVILEAMAMGVPVVSTDVSGVPEVVIDGENGLLVEPNDANALADAIEKILTDVRRAREMGRTGRCKVERKFSATQNIAELAELLREAPRSAGRVAYIVKGFPRLSESFITNEILLLERQGLPIDIYAIKKGEAIAASAIGQLKGSLQYLPAMTSLSATELFVWLRKNLPNYARPLASLMRRRPAATTKAFASACMMMRRYQNPETGRLRKIFLKEFLQAAYIANSILRAGNIGHLHGHFCHGATTVTWFVSRITGIEFSFTAHAKDIYQRELNPGDLLQHKLDAAQFAVTCTAANHAHLAEHHGRPGHLHTIYHGLDTTFFSPRLRTVNEAEKPPQILAVGRYVEKKGFLTLIKACRILHDQGRMFNCVILGEDGDAGDTLRAAISECKLDDCVTLAPPVPQHELRKAYEDASFFALPCTVLDNGDRDGIPNVLAEAMSMGLPVVTTGVSGIPEIVIDRDNGLIVPPKNAQALANAIAELFDDRLLRAEIGANARRTILEKFDSSKTTLDLLRLLRRSLAGKTAA